MMRLPSSTYRLQFRDGMTFDGAVALVPYLDRLGISHLYASPLFTARPGSAHGYDITDANEVDPVLGGRAGLERLAEALQARDMGLVLDIVPNHMAFDLSNPWLRDVLRHGQASRYATHFDIDWSAGRIVLPFLTEEFADAGDIAVAADADGPVMVCGDLRVPLDPATLPESDMARLHDAQAWRLTHWHEGLHGLTHRRFFNVTELIGMRVEEPQVFDDLHGLTFDLVDSGLVQALRVDHVDGLADPGEYLRRLRARLPDTPIWVEKILTGDESLRDWPVQGTTGYVAARAFAQVLTDGVGAAALERAYAAFSGRDDDFSAVVTDAKEHVVTDLLQGELEQLTDLAIAACGPLADAREALTRMLIATPRYRTYLSDRIPRARDRRMVAQIARLAGGGADVAAMAAVLLDGSGEEADRFRVRIQQVTGAAIAKAQEDTAFFRHVALLSANEVGAEPDAPSLELEEFHAVMAKRADAMPHGLTLTSSHDTKRAEDARLRIAAITHDPAPFLAFAKGLRAAAGAIDPNVVWYVAQTALALAGEADAGDRLAAHMQKALREAKEVTGWIDPDMEVEAAVEQFARHAVTADQGGLAPTLALARRLSLVQTALKLTAPGIPDIYQGTEIFSHRLGDPDNRATPDVARLADLLDTGDASPDADKLALTQRLLRLRRARPALFASGSYIALPATNDIIAFARAYDGDALVMALDPSGRGGGVTVPEELRIRLSADLPQAPEIAADSDPVMLWGAVPNNQAGGSL